MVLLVLTAWAGAGRADLITIKSGNGLEGLGDFSGTIQYSAANSANATLIITLTNTSPKANGGYLTAFVFHNPADLITGVGLKSSNKNFSLLGKPTFQAAISAPPFGHYDIGASVTGQFLGGGSPTGGIGVGQSATFTFELTGKYLDELTAASFVGFDDGPHGLGQHQADFLARFRGFKYGSDMVPGVAETPPPDCYQSPEPGTLTLAGIAAAGLLCRGWWTRRRRVD
jgi:hypothetical protein